MQNRAAVLYGVHDLRINEVPVPEPGPRQVLVEVKAVGVCGSDVHYYEHGRVGPYVVREPLILGHESGGVVGRGPGATRHQVGQRVALEPGVPCGACRQLPGRPVQPLLRGPLLRHPTGPRRLLQLRGHPRGLRHPVPDTLSDDAAALLEPLSVGVWACRKGRVTAGSRALVNGTGPIGLVAAQCALAFGATDVTIPRTAVSTSAPGSTRGLRRHMGSTAPAHPRRRGPRVFCPQRTAPP